VAASATTDSRRPLPSGGREVARTRVNELQRARLIAALIEVVESDGYGALTVGRVIAQARVSRKTFYDLFHNHEDAFLAALEQATARVRAVATEAYASQGCWREGIRAALQSMLVLAEQEPGLARLCVVEVMSAGSRVLAFRAQMLAEAAQAIDGGRNVSVRVSDPPAITAEGVTGAILALLHTRLSLERDAPLTDLLGELMSIITLPYLGARAARSELAKPYRVAPEASLPTPVEPSSDPLDGLRIRLTYRTVRTLMVIGEKPGSSNRDVALAAGIADQGQISKLLNRLARLHLIRNVGEGQPKGGSNVWELTPRGERLHKVAWPR
jgi:AcrR family transcriptional regulator